MKGLQKELSSYPKQNSNNWYEFLSHPRQRSFLPRRIEGTGEHCPTRPKQIHRLRPARRIKTGAPGSVMLSQPAPGVNPPAPPPTDSVIEHRSVDGSDEFGEQ